jgi:DNA-directed RNA polymerase specialized sigma24 family protein
MTPDARRVALTDAAALTAIRAGDRAGVDGLYTHHGWAVYDFCRAVVRDDAQAAALTVETFVAAMTSLVELDDPGRVRPLLLAVARGEVLQARGPGAADPDVIVAEAADDDEPDRDVLTSWLWAWLGELDARDRVLLDLHVRQRLHGDALADALMLTPSSAELLRERVMERATTVLRAQLVALTHAGECPALAELVAEWDRTSSPLVPAPVVDHIVLCDRCRTHQLADPLVLVAAIEAAPVPDGLRDRVLAAVTLPTVLEIEDEEDVEDDLDVDDVALSATVGNGAQVGNGLHVGGVTVSGATLAAAAATALTAASPPPVVRTPVVRVHSAAPVRRRVSATGDGPPRLLVAVLVAVGLVALAFMGVLLTRDSSGTGDSAGAVTLPPDAQPAGAGEPRVATTVGSATTVTVATTATSAATSTVAGEPATSAPTDTTATADTTAAAGSVSGEAAPAGTPPAASDVLRTTTPEAEAGPSDGAPPPDAPAATEPPPDTAPPTEPPATEPVPTTAPSPAPSPAPAVPSPALGTPRNDTTPPRFTSVQVEPRTLREATGACSGADHAVVLVEVTDDSGAMSLAGRWTARTTGATGTFALHDDPLLGWTGDLGGIPDTLTGGATSPLDIVLTATDSSGNRWSVGTTITLQDC